jgi:tetratricopeptide (TPR) repeat protein
MRIRCIQLIFLFLAVWVLTACTPSLFKKEPIEPEESGAAPAAVTEDPRAVASLQLTDQGRRLLEDQKPDRAIRVLEQAVSLNPDNGQNYYYLSEAWLKKGFAAQAKEFNHLAEIHLKEDSEWMIRVAKQADKIAELEK